MNILIDNAGFKNKGAELMLNSTIEAVGKMCKKAPNFVACRQKPKNSPHTKLYELRDQKRQNLIPVKLIPQFITKKIYGFVAPKDIDMVLDAGGFWLSDQWADLYSENLIGKKEQFYRSIKNKNGKIIFLPQAFGPFEQDISRRLIEAIYPYIDLLIAREDESYKHLTTVFGENEKIKLYPDFTNIYSPAIKEEDVQRFNLFENRVCIIPNSKMITHMPSGVAEKYIPFMANLAKDLNSKDHKVFFLNHEGDEDEKLITDIIKYGGQQFDYLTGLDADRVKWIIGKSKLCITSRFHGLVSSLSQGVPAFCTSWSHKYEELLKDYRFEEGMLNVNNSKECIKKVISITENPNQYEKIKSVITKNSAVQKELTKKMWEDVNKILG